MSDSSYANPRSKPRKSLSKHLRSGVKGAMNKTGLRTKSSGSDFSPNQGRDQYRGTPNPGEVEQAIQPAWGQSNNQRGSPDPMQQYSRSQYESPLQVSSSFSGTGVRSRQGHRQRVLYVQVMQAKDLPAADMTRVGASDPYVEIIPLEGPNDAELRTMIPGPFPRTKYISNTLQPVWAGEADSRFILVDQKANGNQQALAKTKQKSKLDKNFMYVDFDKLKYLWIKVWDHDNFGKDDLLGGYKLDMQRALSETNMEHQQDGWHNLQQEPEMYQRTVMQRIKKGRKSEHTARITATGQVRIRMMHKEEFYNEILEWSALGDADGQMSTATMQNDSLLSKAMGRITGQRYVKQKALLQTQQQETVHDNIFEVKDINKPILKLGIVRCSGLLPPEEYPYRNPFVKGVSIYYTGEEERLEKQQTESVEQSIDPTFGDEMFVFGRESDLNSVSHVMLEVWDKQRAGNILLGTLRLDLNKISSDQNIVKWYYLERDEKGRMPDRCIMEKPGHPGQYIQARRFQSNKEEVPIGQIQLQIRMQGQSNAVLRHKAFDDQQGALEDLQLKVQVVQARNIPLQPHEVPYAKLTLKGKTQTTTFTEMKQDRTEVAAGLGEMPFFAWWNQEFRLNLTPEMVRRQAPDRSGRFRSAEIKVVSARDLQFADAHKKSSDPYVQVTPCIRVGNGPWMEVTDPTENRRTPVVQNNHLCPIWSEPENTFQFGLGSLNLAQQGQEVAFRIRVIDDDTNQIPGLRGLNDTLGVFELRREDFDPNGAETVLWIDLWDPKLASDQRASTMSWTNLSKEEDYSYNWGNGQGRIRGQNDFGKLCISFKALGFDRTETEREEDMVAVDLHLYTGKDEGRSRGGRRMYETDPFIARTKIHLRDCVPGVLHRQWFALDVTGTKLASRKFQEFAQAMLTEMPSPSKNQEVDLPQMLADGNALAQKKGLAGAPMIELAVQFGGKNENFEMEEAAPPQTDITVLLKRDLSNSMQELRYLMRNVKQGFRDEYRHLMLSELAGNPEHARTTVRTSIELINDTLGSVSINILAANNLAPVQGLTAGGTMSSRRRSRLSTPFVRVYYKSADDAQQGRTWNNIVNDPAGMAANNMIQSVKAQMPQLVTTDQSRYAKGCADEMFHDIWRWQENSGLLHQTHTHGPTTSPQFINLDGACKLYLPPLFEGCPWRKQLPIPRVRSKRTGEEANVRIIGRVQGFSSEVQADTFAYRQAGVGQDGAARSDIFNTGDEFVYRPPTGQLAKKWVVPPEVWEKCEFFPRRGDTNEIDLDYYRTTELWMGLTGTKKEEIFERWESGENVRRKRLTELYLCEGEKEELTRRILETIPVNGEPVWVWNTTSATRYYRCKAIIRSINFNPSEPELGPTCSVEYLENDPSWKMAPIVKVHFKNTLQKGSVTVHWIDFDGKETGSRIASDGHKSQVLEPGQSMFELSAPDYYYRVRFSDNDERMFDYRTPKGAGSGGAEGGIIEDFVDIELEYMTETLSRTRCVRDPGTEQERGRLLERLQWHRHNKDQHTLEWWHQPRFDYTALDRIVKNGASGGVTENGQQVNETRIADCALSLNIIAAEKLQAKDDDFVKGLLSSSTSEERAAKRTSDPYAKVFYFHGDEAQYNLVWEKLRMQPHDPAAWTKAANDSRFKSLFRLVMSNDKRGVVVSTDARTESKPKTLNPEWQQSRFVLLHPEGPLTDNDFQTAPRDRNNRTTQQLRAKLVVLRIELWDQDTFSKDDCLGFVQLKQGGENEYDEIAALLHSGKPRDMVDVDETHLRAFRDYGKGGKLFLKVGLTQTPQIFLENTRSQGGIADEYAGLTLKQTLQRCWRLLGAHTEESFGDKISGFFSRISNSLTNKVDMSNDADTATNLLVPRPRKWFTGKLPNYRFKLYIKSITNLAPADAAMHSDPYIDVRWPNKHECVRSKLTPRDTMSWPVGDEYTVEDMMALTAAGFTGFTKHRGTDSAPFLPNLLGKPKALNPVYLRSSSSAIGLDASWLKLGAADQQYISNFMEQSLKNSTVAGQVLPDYRVVTEEIANMRMKATTRSATASPGLSGQSQAMHRMAQQTGRIPLEEDPDCVLPQFTIPLCVAHQDAFTKEWSSIELNQSSLHLEIFDYDEHSYNDFLGRLSLDFKDIQDLFLKGTVSRQSGQVAWGTYALADEPRQFMRRKQFQGPAYITIGLQMEEGSFYRQPGSESKMAPAEMVGGVPAEATDAVVDNFSQIRSESVSIRRQRILEERTGGNMEIDIGGDGGTGIDADSTRMADLASGGDHAMGDGAIVGPNESFKDPMWGLVNSELMFEVRHETHEFQVFEDTEEDIMSPGYGEIMGRAVVHLSDMIDTVLPGKPNSVPEQTGVWYAKQMRGDFVNKDLKLNCFHYGAQRQRDLLLPLTHPTPEERQVLHVYKNASASNKSKRADAAALKRAKQMTTKHGKNKAMLQEAERLAIEKRGGHPSEFFTPATVRRGEDGKIRRPLHEVQYELSKEEMSECLCGHADRVAELKAQQYPNINNLSLEIVSAKNLMKSDIKLFSEGKSDPYVKVYWGRTDPSSSKQLPINYLGKTAAQKQTLFPKWRVPGEDGSVGEFFKLPLHMYQKSPEMIDNDYKLTMMVYDSDFGSSDSNDDWLGSVTLYHWELVDLLMDRHDERRCKIYEGKLRKQKQHPVTGEDIHGTLLIKLKLQDPDDEDLIIPEGSVRTSVIDSEYKSSKRERLAAAASDVVVSLCNRLSGDVTQLSAVMENNNMSVSNLMSGGTSGSSGAIQQATTMSQASAGNKQSFKQAMRNVGTGGLLRVQIHVTLPFQWSLPKAKIFQAEALEAFSALQNVPSNGSPQFRSAGSAQPDPLGEGLKKLEAALARQNAGQSMNALDSYRGGVDATGDYSALQDQLVVRSNAFLSQLRSRLDPHLDWRVLDCPMSQAQLRRFTGQYGFLHHQIPIWGPEKIINWDRRKIYPMWDLMHLTPYGLWTRDLLLGKPTVDMTMAGESVQTQAGRFKELTLKPWDDPAVVPTIADRSKLPPRSYDGYSYIDGKAEWSETGPEYEWQEKYVRTVATPNGTKKYIQIRNGLHEHVRDRPNFAIQRYFESDTATEAYRVLAAVITVQGALRSQRLLLKQDLDITRTQRLNFSYQLSNQWAFLYSKYCKPRRKIGEWVITITEAKDLMPINKLLHVSGALHKQKKLTTRMTEKLFNKGANPFVRAYVGSRDKVALYPQNFEPPQTHVCYDNQKPDWTASTGETATRHAGIGSSDSMLASNVLCVPIYEGSNEVDPPIRLAVYDYDRQEAHNVIGEYVIQTGDYASYTMDPPGDKRGNIHWEPLTEVHHLQSALNGAADSEDAKMRARATNRYRVDSKGKNPALRFKATFGRLDPNRTRSSRQRIKDADCLDDELSNPHLNLHYEKVLARAQACKKKIADMTQQTALDMEDPKIGHKALRDQLCRDMRQQFETPYHQYVKPTVRGSLRVTVLEAVGLPWLDADSESDPFVVLQLEGQQHRTATIENSNNPKWYGLKNKHEFMFQVSRPHSRLLLSVWDDDQDLDTEAAPMGEAEVPFEIFADGEKEVVKVLYLVDDPQKVRERAETYDKLVDAIAELKEEIGSDITAVTGSSATSSLDARATLLTKMTRELETLDGRFRLDKQYCEGRGRHHYPIPANPMDNNPQGFLRVKLQYTPYLDSVDRQGQSVQPLVMHRGLVDPLGMKENKREVLRLMEDFKYTMIDELEKYSNLPRLVRQIFGECYANHRLDSGSVALEAKPVVLKVRLLEARDVPICDPLRRSSDPFVKLSIVAPYNRGASFGKNVTLGTNTVEDYAASIQRSSMTQVTTSTQAKTTTGNCVFNEQERDMLLTWQDRVQHAQLSSVAQNVLAPDYTKEENGQNGGSRLAEMPLYHRNAYSIEANLEENVEAMAGMGNAEDEQYPDQSKAVWQEDFEWRIEDATVSELTLDMFDQDRDNRNQMQATEKGASALMSQQSGAAQAFRNAALHSDMMSISGLPSGGATKNMNGMVTNLTDETVMAQDLGTLSGETGGGPDYMGSVQIPLSDILEKIDIMDRVYRAITLERPASGKEWKRTSEEKKNALLEVLEEALAYAESLMYTPECIVARELLDKFPNPGPLQEYDRHNPGSHRRTVWDIDQWYMLKHTKDQHAVSAATQVRGSVKLQIRLDLGNQILVKFREQDSQRRQDGKTEMSIFHGQERIRVIVPPHIKEGQQFAVSIGSEGAPTGLIDTDKQYRACSEIEALQKRHHRYLQELKFEEDDEVSEYKKAYERNRIYQGLSAKRRAKSSYTTGEEEEEKADEKPDDDEPVMDVFGEEDLDDDGDDYGGGINLTPAEMAAQESMNGAGMRRLMGMNVTPDDYQDCDDGTEPPKNDSYFVLEVEEHTHATSRGGEVIYLFVEPGDTIAKIKKKIEKHPDDSPIATKIILSRVPFSVVESIDELKEVGNSNLWDSHTLQELRLVGDEEIPKLYATTLQEQLQVHVNRTAKELADKTALMQQLRGCPQEQALEICDITQMKLNEMQNQLKYVQLELQKSRATRLKLEKLQNKVTRLKQSRTQQLTRKLKQATYDLRRVQGINATISTEIQLNYHTLPNPISWLLGDQPLFNSNDLSRPALPRGHFEKGMMVWVRSIGESEFRAGKVLEVHGGGETYDILFDDGQAENRVTTKRIRQPNQEIQGDFGFFCNPFNCCKGCGRQCKTGKCETCCGPCNICGCADCGNPGFCCGSALAGERHAQRHGRSHHGNYSMRERAAVDPYSIFEQMMGNSVDQPSLEQVLQQFYHNMHTRAMRGDPHIEFVSLEQAAIEVQDKWDQIENGRLTLPQLNQELARRFAGNDLNSVFEPILEPMNRAGFCCNMMGSFHGNVKSHHTHLGLVERTV